MEPLHKIEPIVTPDGFEVGVHRMTVPGGWIYWLSPAGQPISTFVPDTSDAVSESADRFYEMIKRLRARDQADDRTSAPHYPDPIVEPEVSDADPNPETLAAPTAGDAPAGDAGTDTQSAPAT